MFKEIERKDEGEFNPVFMMADSGARRQPAADPQLAGMRGLMAKPSGEIIETPITAKLPRGLTVAQYYHLDPRRAQGAGGHGAQDRRLRFTLTRRLVDVAQDIDRDRSWTAGPSTHSGDAAGGGRRDHPAAARSASWAGCPGGSVDVPFHIGRDAWLPGQRRRSSRSWARRNVRTRVSTWLAHPVGPDLRGPGGASASSATAANCPPGACVELGEAVGVRRPPVPSASRGRSSPVAHASTSRHGHSRQGTDAVGESAGGDRVLPDLKTVKTAAGDRVVMNAAAAHIEILDDKGTRITLPPRTPRLALCTGPGSRSRRQKVAARTGPGAGGDPLHHRILTEHSGTVHFRDVIDGVTMKEEVDGVTGLSQKSIVEPGARKSCSLAARIKDAAGPRCSSAQPPVGAHLTVADGQHMEAGDAIAKIPRETTKTQDIPGACPVWRSCSRRASPRTGHHLRDRRSGGVRGMSKGMRKNRESAARGATPRST